MIGQLRVLVLEDTPADAELLRRELKRGGLDSHCSVVDRREDFVRLLRECRPDVILSDHGVPGFDGYCALAIARQTSPEIPFIFVTGSSVLPHNPNPQWQADAHLSKSELRRLVPAIQALLQNPEQDLGEVVRGVLRRRLREFEGKTVDWSIRSLPRVAADPDLLESVLDRLLDIVLHVTADQRHLRIEIAAEEQDSEVILCIAYGSGEVHGATARPDEHQLASLRHAVRHQAGRAWAECGDARNPRLCCAIPVRSRQAQMRVKTAPQ